MALIYRARSAFHWFGVQYSAGDEVDTTGWAQKAIDDLVDRAPVYVIDTDYSGGGTGGGGPEADPVAGPRITTETTRATAAEAAEVAARGTAVSGEQTRAQGAEATDLAAAQAASAAATAETTRATGAEGTEATARAAADTAEASRAQAAESAETTARTSAVSGEATTARAAEAAASAAAASEASRAQGAEAANAAAIAALVQAAPWRNKDVIANMPANGSKPDGSVFKATDQWGGTVYVMIAGVWEQIGPGIAQAVGLIGSVGLTAAFDCKAVGNAWTDIPGQSLDVLARPNGNVRLHFEAEAAHTTGTAAVAATCTIQVGLVDAANAATIIKDSSFTGQQVTAVSVALQGKLSIDVLLKAPVAAATYKLRGRTQAAPPANWGSAQILPNYSATGEDTFYQVAC